MRTLLPRFPRFPETRLSIAGLFLTACGALAAGGIARAAEGGEPEKLDLRALFERGIPPSPFADVAYRYGDAVVAEAKRISLPREASLLRLLDLLGELSGDPKYRRAADRALSAFLEDASPGAAELDRPWIFFDRGFDLAPEASRRFAREVARSAREAARRARDARGVPETAPLSPRLGGFWIRALADAWARTQEEDLHAPIGAVLDALESQLSPAEAPVSPLGAAPAEPAPAEAWLSLAIDADGAARKAPEPLRGRLRRLASRADDVFTALPHDLRGRGAFLRAAEGSERWTSLWEPGPGGLTTAMVAAMCVSRYENTGDLRYRDLVVQAAEAYLDSLPGPDSDPWPATLGQAIAVELAAFRETVRAEFHRRATRLAEFAVERFFADRPLPRGSLRREGYDPSRGPGALGLALVELHLLTRHISAVRAPANALER